MKTFIFLFGTLCSNLIGGRSLRAFPWEICLQQGGFTPQTLIEKVTSGLREAGSRLFGSLGGGDTHVKWEGQGEPQTSLENCSNYVDALIKQTQGSQWD